MDSSEHEPLVPLGDKPHWMEQALQQLQPRPVNLDRDRLMFLAGQASVSATEPANRTWLWPTATLSLSTVAACLAFALTIQIARPPVERIVVREVAAPQPTPVPTPQHHEQPKANPPSGSRFAAAPVLAMPNGSAFQMRNMALRFGIDSIPAFGNSPSAASESPLTPGHWQQLRKAADGTDPSL